MKRVQNENQTKRLKQNSGITLIALIVTILVLLILAGVGIATLAGENGILSKAAEAKEETDAQGTLEKINLAIMASMINESATPNATVLDKELKSYFGSKVTGDATNGWIVTEGANKYKVTTTGEVEEYIEPVAISTLVGKTTVESKTIKVEDETESEKQIFYIPGGFKLASDSATEVDEGIVIEDASGSQFVWVPVPDAIWDGTTTVTSGTYTPMAATYTYNNKTYYRGMLYKFSSTDGTTATYQSGYNVGTTSCREPSLVTGSDQDLYAPPTNVNGENYDNKPEYVKDILGYTDATKFGEQMQKDYDEMVKSVNTYGGFYVGRYETGIETITDGTAGTTTTKIVSKNADTNSSTVTTADASKTETNMWYGLYKAQKGYSTTGSVRSSMIWGSQYDAMMNWMSKTGNTVGTPDSNKYNQETVTGKSTTDVINKVYDLYGCHMEWTLEASYTDGRAGRGGDYGGGYSPASRGKFCSDNADDYVCSRLSLYIVQN